MNIIVEDEAADKENEDKKEKGSFMGIQVAVLKDVTVSKEGSVARSNRNG